MVDTKWMSTRKEKISVCYRYIDKKMAVKFNVTAKSLLVLPYRSFFFSARLRETKKRYFLSSMTCYYQPHESVYLVSVAFLPHPSCALIWP